MKKLFIILSAFFLMFGLTLSSNATTLDFDSMPLGNIDGTDIGGVILTSSTGNASVVLGDASGYGYISAQNTVSAYGDWITTSDLTFTFTQASYNVSFFGGDEGGDLDRFYVDVYGTDNSTLLGTIDTGIFGGYPLYNAPYFMEDNYFVDLSSYGLIGSFVVRDAINAGILIDDLTFEATVPEPATMLLLGSGLLGFAIFRRRIRKS